MGVVATKGHDGQASLKPPRDVVAKPSWKSGGKTMVDQEEPSRRPGMNHRLSKSEDSEGVEANGMKEPLHSSREYASHGGRLPEWKVRASAVAMRTSNPIRQVVDKLDLSSTKSNKSVLSLSIGDPTILGNLTIHEAGTSAVVEAVRSEKANGYPPAIVRFCCSIMDEILFVLISSDAGIGLREVS